MQAPNARVPIQKYPKYQYKSYLPGNFREIPQMARLTEAAGPGG